MLHKTSFELSEWSKSKSTNRQVIVQFTILQFTILVFASTRPKVRSQEFGWLRSRKTGFTFTVYVYVNIELPRLFEQQIVAVIKFPNEGKSRTSRLAKGQRDFLETEGLKGDSERPHRALTSRSPFEMGQTRAHKYAPVAGTQLFVLNFDRLPGPTHISRP